MKRVAAVLVVIVLCASRAIAQQPVVTKAVDDATKTTTEVGDATNHGIRTSAWVGGVSIDPRSIRLLTASDIVTVLQGGTLTVQPGNTPNTTPWIFKIWDAAGNARGANVTAANALVVDGSGVTQPVSGTVTTTPPANASTNISQMNGTTVTMNKGASDAGTQRVTLGDGAQAIGSITNTSFNVGNSPTVQPGNTQNTTPWLTQINDLTASGNITANGATCAGTPSACVTLALNGAGLVGVAITANSGTTLNFEATIEGTQIYTVSCRPASSALGNTYATATGSGQTGSWLCPTVGAKTFNVRASSGSSATVSLRGSIGTDVTTVMNGNQLNATANPLRIDPTGTTTQPVSGTVTATQGNKGSNAQAWWTEIGDGTNGPAAVKAGSTAAQAADPSLVVALSPNSSTVTANAGTNLNTSALALEAGNLATIAGVVTSSRAAVNPISGQAGVQGASGISTATTQRVTLATDVALPTGANTIGAVTQASGPWTSNVTQFGGAAVTIGQQLAANSMPVILPAATVTTLTPPAAITGFALEAGHLAAIDTSTASGATAANQTTGNASLATIAGAVDTPGTSAPQSAMVIAGVDPASNTTTMLSAPAGVLQVQLSGPQSLLLPCNPIRTKNCR